MKNVKKVLLLSMWLQYSLMGSNSWASWFGFGPSAENIDKAHKDLTD